MNASYQSSTRGALKHWVISCLGVIGILIILVASGGYYAYTKFREKVDMGSFDVTSKFDPPATTDINALLPSTAGQFKRTVLTTETATMRSAPFPTMAGTTDQVTSGMVMGVYADGSGHGALVIALSSDEAKKREAERRGPFANMQGKPQPNKGFHMRVGFGPQPFDMALWGKQNWTFIVQTTDTAALEFAKDFQPQK